MIGKDPTQLHEPIQTTKRFAALSGPFEPGEAIQAVAGAHGTDALVAITAHLASTCDTQLQEGSTWLMREPERHWILDEIAADGRLDAAVAWRREQAPVDDVTRDLLDALDGIGMFSEAAIDERLAGSGSRDELERIAVALERAGAHAPASDRKESVRASLTRIDVDERDQALLERGFYGRAGELTTIADWLARPVTSRPVTTLFITGLPGIGKSTLLEEAVRQALAADPMRSLVRLDFDRAGLDALDWIGLTLELARQVATQIPDHADELRTARLVAAGGGSTQGLTKGDLGRQIVPTQLVAAIVRTLRASGRSVLFVLDTLEVLRGRAQTRPARLFDWLDELVSLGISPMSVLSAGRGDAFDAAPERVGSRISLPGLEDADADRLMTKLQIPGSSFADVRELAEGNPLVIRLAARVIDEDGPASLEARDRGQGLAAAYLYRILLSRIDDDMVRDLAHPGLVVRRIDPTVIGEVLGPELGFGVIPPDRARELFDILASHHWLVEEDPLTPGFVKHRSDIRSLLLRLLYEEDPQGCAKIDRAAAKWFARRPEEWCAVEAAYHRLQLMRRSKATPQLDPAVLLLLDDDTIDELPDRAQDVVRRARGERSTQFRGGPVTRGSDVDPSAAVELQGVIDRGDWVEGQYLYDRTFAVSMFDARSADADVARAFLWRSGRWAEAQRLDHERRRLGGDDGDIAALAPVVAMVRLEMWAEARFGALVSRLRRDPDLLAQAAALRQRAVSSDLGSGALGFALRLAGVVTAPPSSIQIDSIGTAFATWAPGEAGYGESRDALAMATRRLESTVGGAQLDWNADHVAARLLAIDTPYVSPVGALLQTHQSSGVAPGAVVTLSEHLIAVDARIVRLGGLAPSGTGAWSARGEASAPPSAALERLTSLGLFAEWVGAAAFESRDPDLRLIATAAERWRRTMAGRWSYARRPPGASPGWTRALDVSVVDRIEQLQASTPPTADPLEQLGAWSVTGDADHVRRALERRFRATFARRADAEPAAVAAALLRRSVPSALVPSLAVLAGQPDKKGRSS